MRDKGFFDWVIDSMAFVAGVLLSATVLIESLEIIMRYFIHKPLVWSVEVCEYILFSVAFLGAPWLLKKGGHVNVDIVLESLSKRKQGYLGLLCCGIGIFVSAVICWFGLMETWKSYKTGMVITKTLSIHKHYFLFLIPFGYFLLLVEFGRQFLHHLGKLKKEVS